MQTLSLSTVAAAAAIATRAFAGSIIFVDTDAPGGGDGQSWETAFDDLQSGLALAGEGTQIWVAQGTYLPDAGTGNRGATFAIPGGVAVFGGFEGTEQTLEERDPIAHPTELSGDLAANDPTIIEDNTQVIVTVSGGGDVLTPTVIDGFTVSGAFNDDALPLGGAILHEGGFLEVRQSHLVANTTLGSGGAIFATGAGRLTIEDSVVEGNRAIDGFAGSGVFLNNGMDGQIARTSFIANMTEPGLSVNPGSGGGLHCFQAGLVDVVECHFEGNRALTGGAFASVLTFGITMTDCTFVDNLAVGLFGGAVRLDRSDNPPIDDHPTIIDGCLFLGNEVDGLGQGSAIFATENVLDVSRSVFLGNTAGLGATIGIRFETGHRFENCVVANNTAESLSGFDVQEQAQISIANCTIADNTSTDLTQGAGIFVSTLSTADIDNTILWGNRGFFGEKEFGGELAQILLFSNTTTVDFSLVEGLTGALGGVGNIGDDPLFVDAAGNDGVPGTIDDDFSLRLGSPAIDAANNDAIDATIDVGGVPRLADDGCTDDTGNGDPPIADMGAHEFQGSTCDLDGSGLVGTTDLLALLAAWGSDPGGPPDFNGDGNVGAADLLQLLGNWG
ncbi:MAG: right-handed parallel beta-helix repeat-containing protein [Vicinamibacterales bacterium]